jgi:hypothetical protein
MGKREGILRARKGAVLAEFAIAFMPICAMFLVLCQLSRYYIARLAVMHAAQVAVRACAVIYEPQPGFEKKLDGDPAEVVTAAKTAMAPFNQSNASGHEVYIDDPKCDAEEVGQANGGTDKVEIVGHYNCTIPLARGIVCPSGEKTWTVEAQFPHQGADYKLD